MNPLRATGTLRVLLICFTGVAVLPAAAQDSGESRRPSLSVYFPDYRYRKDLDPQFYATSHLILFSSKPNPDGSVDFSRITPGLLEIGKMARAQNGAKVTFCAGGWGRGGEFAAAVSLPENRARFVEALAGFCETHGLDGVDIDWEFPKGEQQHADFAEFLRLLSGRLRQDGRILTVALGYSRPLPAECWAFIDQVNLMSYQPWTPQPYEEWLEGSIHRFLEAGLPPEKLLLGVGFFAKEKAGERRAVSWRKLADGEMTQLPESEHGFWPAGKEDCDLRVRLVEKYGLGGVMVWDWGHDTMRPEDSLLRHLSLRLFGGTE